MITDNKNKFINIILFFAGLLLTVAVAFLPYVKQGLPGHFVDMVYQMERIEGLKNALKAFDFPPRIYPDFFSGYGYGSPLFYSDVFFIFPALLRILGFSMTQTWKLFVLFLISLNYIVTFISFKYICKNFYSSLTGTVSLVLCQFYLMDLAYRSGLGEYMAIILLPVLLAAIYDYLILDGKRIWLFGIAFGGMLLCHTIMVFLAFIFTVFVFICALISKKYRKKVFVLEKIKKLLITALFTIGITAYYFLPMLEQMISGKFLYQTPWVHLSDYLAPLSSLFLLKGSMFFTANVGLGVSLWCIVVYMIVALFMKNKNPEAVFLIVLGLVIAVITTDIFPWKIFDNTVLNNIQFSFRILPYAMCPIALGGAMLLAGDTNRIRTFSVTSLILVTSVVFGIYQNAGLTNEESTYSISDEFLKSEGTMYVGKGEWFPEGMNLAEFEMAVAGNEFGRDVESSDGSITLSVTGLNKYSFEANEASEFIMPLVYYKGYKAKLYTEGSKPLTLSTRKNSDVRLSVINDTGLTGRIEVTYSQTACQIVASIISFLSLISIIIISIRIRKNIKEVT